MGKYISTTIFNRVNGSLSQHRRAGIKHSRFKEIERALRVKIMKLNHKSCQLGPFLEQHTRLVESAFAANSTD